MKGASVKGVGLIGHFCSVVKHVCLFVHYGLTQNVLPKKPSKHHCSSKTKPSKYHSTQHGFTTRLPVLTTTKLPTTTTLALTMTTTAAQITTITVRQHQFFHNHHGRFNHVYIPLDGADLDYHDVCGHHNYHSSDNHDYHAGVDHDYHDGCDHCDYDDGTDYNPHSLYSTDYCRVKG